MQKEPFHPNLDLFFRGYLNQDYRFLGNSVVDIINIYKNDITPSMRHSAISEIDDFKKFYKKNLDAAFENSFGQEISIEPWGFTALSFLDELKRLLQEE